MIHVLALSGCAQAGLIGKGVVSSVELVRAHLERIHEVNPALNAAVDVLEESALREARMADERRAKGAQRGRLDGVPFSVKDSIEVADRVCSAGTIGLSGSPPAANDATVVSRLRAAGAIPIARTNLPDLLFAFESDNLLFGRTNNPYDLSRTSGGSSGGEAALIASCASPFGLGSDAAGSVRLPAHFCGIAAIKPTSGRLPRTGHVPPAGGWLEAVWQIGPMARRVEDLAALMPILLGPDGHDRTAVAMPWRDPSQVRLADLRAAFFTSNGIAAVEPETADVVGRAARALAADVAAMDERTPPGIEDSYHLEMKLIGPDGGDSLRHYLEAIGSTRTHPLLDAWLAKLEPYRTTLAGFAGYWAQWDEFRAAMTRFLESYDVVISPVSASPAVPHGTSIEDSVFPGFSYTMTYNVTGWPAAVVRCGESSNGLPIGVQVAARPWREDIALALALRLEEIFGGWRPAHQ